MVHKLCKRFANKRNFIGNMKTAEIINMLSTLLKKAKKKYYNQYFKANMNNIKNLMD